jgi:spore germination protein YaaH
MKRVLILFLFLCLFIDINAQKSILEEINTTLAQEQGGHKSKSSDSLESNADTSLNSELSADTSKMKDSLSKELTGKAGKGELSGADTQLFKQRMANVKKPFASKDLKSESEWAKEKKIFHNVKYEKEHMLDTNYKVFGWHPYWCGDAYKSYNYSLLSMVSYFSYEVNPETGFYTSIHNWRETGLLDSAKKHGCKVLLTLSNLTARGNKKFLRSSEAQKNLIATAITLIREREADGLTLDFENVQNEDRSLFTNFIIDLSTSLKEENEDYLLTIALPAMDFENVYDFSQINMYVDLYVMMGYEYHGENSPFAGPIAPLSNGAKWNGFSIENSVDEYLANGAPPEKFLLGIPYYGAEWTTKHLKFPSSAESFIKYHTYREAKRITGKKNGDVDNASMSKFYAYSDRAANYRQLWYEDSVTLEAKYDFVKDKKIGGIGIWALGYDNGHDELWRLLADKFAYNEDEVKEIQRSRRKLSFRRIMMYVKRLIRNPKSVISRPRSFLRIFGAFTGVSLIGLFLVLRYTRKFKRFIKLILKGGIAAIVILTIALIFIFFRYFDIRELLFLIGGFVLGGVLFLLFTRRYISEKDLP